MEDKPSTDLVWNKELGQIEAKPKRSHKKKVAVPEVISDLQCVDDDQREYFGKEITGLEAGLPPMDDEGMSLIMPEAAPFNRQQWGALFRRQDKATRNELRKNFTQQNAKDKEQREADRVAYGKPARDPSVLPTHLIHDIFKKRGVSIRFRQHRIGMIGAACDHTEETIRLPGSPTCGKHITKFNGPLFYKILKRRGKKRAIRQLVERNSRVTNRAA